PPRPGRLRGLHGRHPRVAGGGGDGEEPMTEEILARAIGLTRHYGDVVALDNVTLDIREGELVGLLGPNGAGKSTLINLFVGLRRPTSGTVELFGGPPSDPARRLRMGMTPQETGLSAQLRVGECVDFVSAHYP